MRLSIIWTELWARGHAARSASRSHWQLSQLTSRELTDVEASPVGDRTPAMLTFATDQGWSRERTAMYVDLHD